MAPHPSWTLPSNSGRERATWTVTAENEDAGERLYTCRVLLEGSFYGETLPSGEAGPAQDFGLFDQALRLRFGPREDTLSGGHPVATLEYVVERMKGELSFAVDPNGLQTMSDELNQALTVQGRGV